MKKDLISIPDLDFEYKLWKNRITFYTEEMTITPVLDDLNEIIDELKNIGAEGILVIPIEKMVL